jgi:hypothetical protein
MGVPLLKMLKRLQQEAGSKPAMAERMSPRSRNPGEGFSRDGGEVINPFHLK